jgi:hypothetical protein
LRCPGESSRGDLSAAESIDRPNYVSSGGYGENVRYWKLRIQTNDVNGGFVFLSGPRISVWHLTEVNKIPTIIEVRTCVCGESRMEVFVVHSGHLQPKVIFKIIQRRVDWK